MKNCHLRKTVHLPNFRRLGADLMPRQRSLLYLLLLFLFFMGPLQIRAQTNLAVSTKKKSNTGQSSQLKIYDQGSAFFKGYACIKQGDRYFYIDRTGTRVFDTILNGQLSDLSQRYSEADRSEQQNKVDKLPSQYLLIAKNGKLGVLSMEGQLLLAPVYDKLELDSRVTWQVFKDGRQSLFSAGEGFLLPFEFEQVWQMDDNFFNVVKAGKWGVYSRSAAKLVIPCIYEDMDYCYGCTSKGDYVFAKKNGKWGIVDVHNKVLLPFAYEHRHSEMRSDEWVFSLLRDGQPLSINLKSGKVLPRPPRLDIDDRTEKMADGFIRREKNDKWGMLNGAGKLIYDYAYDFIRYDADQEDGYYLPAPFVALRKNDLCGVGDTTGKILIPVIHKDWVYNIDRLFVGRVDSLETLYDATGKPVISGKYDLIHRKTLSLHKDSTAGYIIMLKKRDKFGFYNPKTNCFVPPKYDGIDVGRQMSWADSSLVEVRLNQPNGDPLKGLVDLRTGKEVLPPEYSSFSSYLVVPDNILVRSGNQSGIYNIALDSFTFAVGASHLSLLELPDLVRVTMDTLEGLRDMATGAEVCPSIYNHIYPINKTLYILLKNKKGQTGKYQYFLFNKQKGSTVSLPYSNMAFSYVKNRLLVMDSVINKGKLVAQVKLFDPVNNKVITGAYSEGSFPNQIGGFFENRAFFYKNDKYGIVDPDGRLIQPAIYDNISSFKNGRALVMQQKDSNGQDKSHFVYGVIDTTGKLLLPIKYDYVTNSSYEDYFAYKPFITLYQATGAQSQLMHSTRISQPGEKRKSQRSTSSLVDYESRYLMGLATMQGRELIAAIYDNIYLQRDGPNILVKKSGKFGVLDGQGEVLLAPIYPNLLLERPIANYMDKANFSFPMLAEMPEQSKQSSSTWQYLDEAGRPLSKTDIRVKAPMQNFPHKIRALF